jgi:hypothetical protein
VDAAVRLWLAAALAAGLYAQQSLGARLQSDGFYYYAYLRSLAFDGDVNLLNDYRLLGLGHLPHLFEPTATGHAPSVATIGPAIIWSPFFAAGHAVARFVHARDERVAVDGTSYPYRQAVCIAGLVYGLLGLWFCYRLASLWYRPALAAAAMVLIGLGSFELWYLVKEPTMTHAPSMAAVAAFFYAWARTRGRRRLAQWLLLGLLAGLMTTIRWQNALFAIVPACEALWALRAGVRSGQPPVARTLADGVGFTAAAVIAFLPQMLTWKALYGGYVAVAPLGPQIRWGDSRLVDVLWSSRNGLFATSPLVYVGVLGLFRMLRVDPHFAVPGLLSIVAMAYFNGAIQDWWGSASFGMRRFDGILPLTTVGIAAALEWLTGLVARRPALVAAASLGLLVVWNLTFMQAALRGRFDLDRVRSMGDIAGEQARALHERIGHPFSYPVNLLWAMRSGVSPARYDVLGPGRFLADPMRPYGRIDIGADDEPFLTEGWYSWEQHRDRTFRWTRATAGLLVPLDRAAPLEVRVDLMPFTPTGWAPARLRVRINDRTFGPFALEEGWQAVEFTTTAADWRAGVNRMWLESDREVTPAAAGGSADARPLALAVDAVRVRIPE